MAGQPVLNWEVLREAYTANGCGRLPIERRMDWGTGHRSTAISVDKESWHDTSASHLSPTHNGMVDSG